MPQAPERRHGAHGVQADICNEEHRPRGNGCANLETNGVQADICNRVFLPYTYA